MSSYWEYDQEAHEQALREDGYDDGYDAGKSDGYNEGLNAGIILLVKNGKLEKSVAAETLNMTVEEFDKLSAAD